MASLISSAVLGGSFDTVLSTTGLVNGDSVLLIVGEQEDTASLTVPSDFTEVTTAPISSPSEHTTEARLKTRIYSGTVSGSPSSYTVTATLFGRAMPCILLKLESTESLGDYAEDVDEINSVTSISSPSVDPVATSTTQLIWCHGRGTLGAGTTLPSGFTSLVQVTDSAVRSQEIILASSSLTSGDPTAAASWTGLDGTNYKVAASLIIESSGGVTNPDIDTQPSTVARGETGVILGSSSGNFGATQGTGTVTFGGQACTVTAWSDTSITVTIPTAISLQHSATGHSFVVTTDNTATDSTTNVPFTPATGDSYTDLTNPDTADSTSILFGYTGDAPVTGDQVVYSNTTSPDSIAVTEVTAEGYITLASDPTQTQTIDRYVIQSDGTVGTEDTYTFTVTGPIAPTMPADDTVAILEGNLLVGFFPASSGTGPITYSLTGVDSSFFNLNSSTAQLSFLVASDYETQTSYSVTVTATNSQGSDSQNVTVNLNNVLEVTITDGGPLSIEIPKGDTGLSRTDSRIVTWTGTFTNSTSNNLATHPATLTVVGSPYSVTFSANDAADVINTITITEQPQFAPTDIIITSTSIPATAVDNTVVGSLSSVDQNVNDTHTYSLVAGAGSTDNASFNILNDTLRCNSPSTLGAGTYSVRIQTSDGTDTYQKVFTITVSSLENPDISNEGLWLAVLDNAGFTSGSIVSRQRAWLNQQLSILEDTQISVQGLWLQFLLSQSQTDGSLTSRLKAWYEDQLGQTYPDLSLSSVEALWLRGQV